MRTNIVLDDELVEEAFRYANVKTKKELVHLALKEFVDNAKRLSLLDLKGKVSFADDYDHKSLRGRDVSN